MVGRIKQVMDYKGLTPAVFAETIGINRSNLTHLFSGRNQPSLDLAKKILVAFPDIRTEWLIMGMGNMLQNVDNELVTREYDNRGVDEAPFDPDLFSVQNSSQDIDNQLNNTKTSVDEVDNVVPVESVAAVPSQSDSEQQVAAPVEARARRNVSTRNRANISAESSRRVQKIDSREDNPVKKIVFFYADNSFEVFFPQN